jgi:glycosyltransferase involved in cell wall biosynthesis
MIHDPIDCNLFAPRIKNRGKRITLGWEGNPQAHYENLAMLVKPLEMLSCECALKLKLVSSLGDPKVKKLFKGLETKMEVEYGSKHWLSAKDFAASLSDFDIMLAPIQKTPWYEGKSALRVGIGMAMGIPVVASPVGEQKYVIRHKVNGFLAQNDQDWYSCLKLLIDDYELRRDMGRRGRETAEKELSLRVCGNKLLKIITGSILDLEISQTTTH